MNIASEWIQMLTCLAIRSVAADGETPSPIPTYRWNGMKVINNRERIISATEHVEQQLTPESK